MNLSKFKKVLAVTLALTMVIPTQVYATNNDESVNYLSETDEIQNEEYFEEEAALSSTSSEFVSETHDVFSRTTSTIAPGVTQDIVYAYAKDGKQMAYYVATADITREDVAVYANYKDNQCVEFGMSKLTEQMAAAQEKHSKPDDPDNYIEYYNVVAGVNADFYNMTTGQPSGAFVMEGVITNNANNRPFFAILKDGTPVIGANNTDWAAISGQVQEAVGGSQVLVKDGVDVTATASGSYNTDRHSRTCVGITADGKVVMMSLDGRQEPFSCGGTMHELAQIMLEAGCVAAINLDGGGSTTFAARQEGANKVTVVNRPSDGSERSISSSLMVVSTAVPSDVFERAVLTAEHTYVTPGATVNVNATGVSPAGTSAEIPEGISWQLEDNTLGTVEDGVFVSSGIVGDAIVQMVYNDAVVGQTTIHVVVPEVIKFNSAEVTVPYGKTVVLDITATYGLNKVTLKDDDVSFELTNDAVGTIEGFSFTACEENEDVTGATIAASLNANPEVSCSVVLNLGKGSEVIEGFEEGVLPETYVIKTGYPQYGPQGSKKDENGNYYYNGQNELGSLEIVTAENGQVHDGDYAMAVECDYSQPYETGYHMLTLNGLKWEVPAKAQTIGMWLYLPELEELYTTSMRFAGTSESGASVNAPWLWDNCSPYGWENDGWRYVSMDLSGYNEAITFNTIQLYICDRDNTDLNFYFKDHSSVNGKFTYYMDSITVDYSSAVDDREMPVFEYVRASYGGLSDAVELKGQTINSNVVSVTTKVGDDMTKNNYTGINISTAKAYIDGVELTTGVSCTDAGIMTIDDVTLADGAHSFKFEICDNMGNKSSVERDIVIAAGSDLTSVNIVPDDESADKLLIGSVYWMNIETSNVENIQSVKTELNLNSVSTWELDHMEVAEGFSASYEIDTVTNNAIITIVRTDDNTAVGEGVLAKLPIRTWVSRLTEYEGYESCTPTALWKRKIIWPMDIKLDTKLGQVVLTDGSESSFAMLPFAVDTELYGNYAELNENGDYANKTSWHVHTAETLEEKTSTCTTKGYTGRTFCQECNSVVEWGTTIPAKGHNFSIVDGILKCECELLFTGNYEGKEYVDGVLVATGWQGDSYYVDGVKLTGIQFVEGYYYNFGEDGISKGKYTGLICEDGTYRYSKLGTLASGWVMIDEEWYYFDEKTGNSMPGLYEDFFVGVDYEFEETGRLVSGVWKTTEKGSRYYYGPDYYRGGGNTATTTWYVIDGDTYCIDQNGYRYEGMHYVLDSNSTDAQWYNFDENGVLTEKLVSTGLLETNGNLYYLDNGISKYGMFEVDGAYYYMNSKDYSAVTGEVEVVYPNGCLPAATYRFGSDYKLISEYGIKKDDDGEIRYYVDGIAVYAGLAQDAEGNYYYINSSLKAVKNCTYMIYEHKTNGMLPAGEYTFGVNGKMYTGNDPDAPEIVNGLKFDEDGEIRYYENGVAVYAGLVQDAEGNYYYINSSLKAVKNCTYTIYEHKTNGLLEAGEYRFGADGKMLTGNEPDEVAGLKFDEDGEIRYYEDGVAVYAGLVQDAEGNYYYINSSLKAVKNCTYTIYEHKTNGLLEAGVYTFGADGKMLIENEPDEPTGLTGLNFDEDGEIRYYEDGVAVYAGLVQDAEGNYYYINSSLKAVKNCTYTIYEHKTNGLLEAGVYTFGADGKML